MCSRIRSICSTTFDDLEAPMRVELNHALCQGHARCAALAPELFELDDNGYVITESHDLAADTEEAARLGAKVCPEKVISVQG
jgi:ferredoxin